VRITCDTDDNGLIEVRGEIDHIASQLLDQALRSVISASSGRVIVDLSSVTFLDTASLRALVRARAAMDCGGRWLVVRGAQGQPRRLLEIGRAHYGVML
jgi:anti-anti-sigma factor